MTTSSGGLERLQFEVLVVMFQPTDEDLVNLATLRELGLTGFVVDNSPRGQEGDVRRLWPQASYVRPPANRGTAHATALAARSAVADWLLVLDQDSKVTAKFIMGASEVLRTVEPRCGQVAPKYASLAANSYSRRRVQRYPRTPILSGSLLRLAALREVEDMSEWVPLDGFDFALSLSLQARRWEVRIAPEWLLEHRVGDGTVALKGRRFPQLDAGHAVFRYSLMGGATRYFVVRFGRRFPQWVARHLAARTIQLAQTGVRAGGSARVAAFLRGLIAKGDACANLPLGGSESGL